LQINTFQHHDNCRRDALILVMVSTARQWRLLFFKRTSASRGGERSNAFIDTDLVTH
jgi:hypothetical protein